MVDYQSPEDKLSRAYGEHRIISLHLAVLCLIAAMITQLHVTLHA